MKERVYAMRGGMLSLLDYKDAHTRSNDENTEEVAAAHITISFL